MCYFGCSSLCSLSCAGDQTLCSSTRGLNSLAQLQTPTEKIFFSPLIVEVIGTWLDDNLTKGEFRPINSEAFKVLNLVFQSSERRELNTNHMLQLGRLKDLVKI